MRIIQPNAEYLRHEDADGEPIHPYRFIERIGRICYKSEDKIGDGTDKKFVAMLLNKKHLAMLEHDDLYFRIDRQGVVGSLPFDQPVISANGMDSIMETPFRYMHMSQAGTRRTVYWTGSFSAFIQLMEWAKDKLTGFDTFLATVRIILQGTYPEIFGVNDGQDYKGFGIQLLNRQQFIDAVKKENTEDDTKHILFRHLSHTVVFTCDRGVTHEFVRHRPASFAQESTRYCDYTTDRLGNGITVIDPPFFDESNHALWQEACENAGASYQKLVGNGAKAQEARDVLPHSTAVQIAITAVESEWQHIINLRSHATTGAPHPQMKQVMDMALPYLTEQSEGRLV